MLDLGCGKVPMYGMYAEYVSSVICADWPNSVHGTAYIDCAMDLNEPLAFAADSFDTVLLSDVLEHIAEPGRLMREIAYVLRPLGKLILGVPFLYWIHESPYDYFRYTEFALQRFCRDAGLRPISLQAYGGAAHVMADLIAKHSGDSVLTAWAGSAVARGLAFSFFGRQISTRTVGRVPLGYLLVADKPFAPLL